jgi:hypothetical protein
MSQQLEQELQRVLRDATASAPRMDHDFVGQLDRRDRRRRRARLQIVGASVAAVVVLGGVGIAPRVLPKAAQEPQMAAPRSGPVAKVWPKAFHRIPVKLEDGRSFSPRTFLDERTLLVSAATPKAQTTSTTLYRYDLETQAIKKIADVPDKRELGGLVVAGDWILWSDVGMKVQPDPAIWAVPKAGGTPHKVAQLPRRNDPREGRVERIALDGETVYWSYLDTDLAIQRAPLSGGAPADVPDTKGYHIVSWPWVGTPGPARTGSSARSQLVYRDLRNVTTGETKSAKAQSGTLECHVTWCVGAEGPLNKEKDFVAKRDGSDRGELPIRRDWTFAMPLEAHPVLDRFAVSPTTVYDLKTGDYGFRYEPKDIAPESGGSTVSLPDTDDRMVMISLGDTFDLLDLGAIE